MISKKLVTICEIYPRIAFGCSRGGSTILVMNLVESIYYDKIFIYYVCIEKLLSPKIDKLNIFNPPLGSKLLLIVLLLFLFIFLF